jgi:hypothetical protein
MQECESSLRYVCKSYYSSASPSLFAQIADFFVNAMVSMVHTVRGQHAPSDGLSLSTYALYYCRDSTESYCTYDADYF